MKTALRKTALFISTRYLFSKKKHNVINVLSVVSMLGIMVSSAALVVVLSVFNGMQNMIGGWFNAFNPDFEVTLVEGKSFAMEDFPKSKIAALPEVDKVYEVVSDMVLTTYQERQELLKIKGVEKDYVTDNHYENLLIDGTFDLQRGTEPCAVLGTAVAGRLLVNLKAYDRMKLFYPKRTKKNLANPADAFNTELLTPTGVFCTNTNYDQELVFCPIEFARALMRYEDEATSVEVQLKKNADYKKTQAEIQRIVGDKYMVQNKYQQEASLFKTMQSEKLIIYVILAFILLVAAFNIIGSLGMLVLEKQQDTLILRTMGADNGLIQRIFLYEGMLISAIGGIAGMLLGALICLLQQIFHIVKLGGPDSNYLIPYYPVQMKVTDFLIVLVTVLVISLLTSLLPARKLKSSLLNQSL